MEKRLTPTWLPKMRFINTSRRLAGPTQMYGDVDLGSLGCLFVDPRLV